MSAPRPIDLMCARTFQLLAKREGIKSRLAIVQRKIHRQCSLQGITEEQAVRLAANHKH